MKTYQGFANKLIVGEKIGAIGREREEGMHWDNEVKGGSPGL